ncbi:LacI family DNA-binding transcriptional regulator [Clostridium sp. YIM B02505]|uniref:LacI family DNA-binding transcriptional regulator n=1 Tax=Clostridium yunnanense TaxID=2800325 RepID=A0ABS1EX93_9CLOT|nr:LacI family DNA-binding transcriptional regulator [Clostridium yunnanense]MBK1813987.1 LacI family DNA-binding transcriptional regulator [Clostridium yunnanense]
MKVTMKDIANRLGISINAVSIALNDKVGVSEEMRLEILRTADEMGYINQKRQYLSVLSKTNICILMQSYYADTGHFYSIVLRSIVEQAKAFGYFSILNYFEDTEFAMPKCILERKVAGILVVGKISDYNLMLLKKTGVPVVLVDFTSLCDPSDCVLTHNKQGGYMVANHVIQKGYKKIGFFGDLDYSFSFEDRFLGYKQALLKSNITDYQNIDSYIDKYSFIKGIEKFILANQISDIINILQSKELPEVLICANDSNAFAVISALKDMGIKVPEDIGVVGFDDTPLCEKSIPQITTVQVQKELMGQVAVSNLIDRIHRKDNIPMTQLLSVKVVERDSLKLRD